jgi:hypothetical protein
MKHMFFLSIFLCGSIQAADPEPIHTERLAKHFRDNGISYQTYANFNGNTTSNTYAFLDYPDPADDETLGLFFEFRLYNGLKVDDNMHLAAGIRGPVSEEVSGEITSVTRGRGLAIGQLWTSFHYTGTYDNMCYEADGDPAPAPTRGFFVEDFTESLWGVDMHATDCEDINLLDYSTFRVDIHASKLNVYIAVWKKNVVIPGMLYSYDFLGEQSCFTDTGFFCPESDPVDPYDEAAADYAGGYDDSSVGNGFILVADSIGNQNWQALNIYMAHWKN